VSDASDPADNISPGSPSDNTTVTAILDDLCAQGWTGQFSTQPDAVVRCYSCRTDSEAAAVCVDSIRRTEGASNPEDMLALVTVTCPSCQAKGVLTLNYGPEGSNDDSDVLLHLRDERSDGDVGSTE